MTFHRLLQCQGTPFSWQSKGSIPKSSQDFIYYSLFPFFLSASSFLNGHPLVRLSAPVRFDILPFSVPKTRLQYLPIS